MLQNRLESQYNIGQSASGLVKAHKLLADSRISYWLDSGSLLGLIREGAEISWDTDIDVGIWSQDVPQADQALKKLDALGYKVSKRVYKGRVYGFTIEDGQKNQFRPIHIHVYFQQGPIAWSPQTVTYRPVDRAGATKGFAPWPRLRQILLRIRQGARERKNGSILHLGLGYSVYYPAWGLLVLLRNRMQRQGWVRVWPYSALYAMYTWIVPAKHFLYLELKRIGDVDIPVPGEPQQYLALRYKDWQTPVSDWCYWTDDPCIYPGTPEEVLAALN